VEEAMGQNPRILKSGAQSDAYYAELWQTITSGREWRGEFHNKRKDGTLYWEQASIAPIYDAMGRMMNLIAIKEDITERKRAEEALRRRNRELTLLNRVGQELTATFDRQQVAEQSLRATIETVGAEGASIWLWDEAREGYLVCQAFAAGTMAHDRERAMVNLCLEPGQGVAGWVARTGKSAVVPNAPDDPRFFPGIDEQTGFRTRSLLTVPLQVRDTIIGVLEVVNKQRGAFDADDLILVETLAASAAIAIDNALLVETLRQYALQLEAHNEELDAFAHTVAHDLKNPLSPLVGYAEVLAMDYAAIIDAEGLSYLRKIVQSGRKMNNIIDELLLLAGARKMDVDVEPVDMARIVRQAQQRLGFMIKEQQAEIVLPETWPTALGYGPWIEEVWVNYVSNALKYGGQPPHVELGADVGQADDLPHDAVRFWVRDDGPGLSPEEQVRLFTPFTRLDQVRAKGHGLGLSIVRRIVEKLGGQVGVESEVGAGSLFWFTLPAANGDTLEK
jgi:signal transduction histidine kinase